MMLAWSTKEAYNAHLWISNGSDLCVLVKSRPIIGEAEVFDLLIIE